MHIKNYREFFTASKEGRLTVKGTETQIKQYSLIKGIWNYLFGKDAILCTDRFSVRFISKSALEKLNNPTTPLQIKSQEELKTFLQSLVTSVKKEVEKWGNPKWHPVVKEAAAYFKNALSELASEEVEFHGAVKHILVGKCDDQNFAFELNIMPKEGKLTQEEFMEALYQGLENANAWYQKPGLHNNLSFQSYLFGKGAESDSGATVYRHTLSTNWNFDPSAAELGTTHNEDLTSIEKADPDDMVDLLEPFESDFKREDSVDDFFKKKVLK